MKKRLPTADPYFDRMVNKIMTERDEVARKMHTPSGKLSASSLGTPLQWNMLKLIGIPSNEMEPYVLRKFLRGIQVEKQVVEWLDIIGCAREKQKPIEYKGVVGYVDVMVDMKDWDTIGLGVIPHEIKSVMNSKLKYMKDADPWHRLQGTLYAMATKTNYYMIQYVSGEDYQIFNFLFETKDTAPEVEEIIEQYNKAKVLHKVPVFEPKYSWQANDDFNNYPDWAKLTEGEIEEKLKEEFPEAYQKLQLL